MTKYSKQRELILSAVKDNPIHPTAEAVYHLLKREHPELSLGTVYRNLNFLACEGSIQKLKMPQGADRFDADERNHCHMTCDTCGQVVDLCFDDVSNCVSDFFSNIEQEMSSLSGNKVTSYNLTFLGTCKDCLKKGPKSAS